MTKQAVATREAQEQDHAVLQTPRVNIIETDTSYTIEAEMPGVGNDAIEVHIEQDTLTLTGKRTQSDGTRLTGRCCDGYRRAFTLGEAIDRERVEAMAKDGILRVVLHKVAAKVPRRIEVQVG